MGWADNYPAYKEGGLVITDSNIYFAEYDHSGAKYFMSKKLELNAIQETILIIMDSTAVSACKEKTWSGILR